MHPTEALTTLCFANFLRMTDAVGLVVFGLFILVSIVSWYFIILKSARVARIRTRSHRVVATFWKTPVDQAIGYLERQPDWEPFSKIGLDGEFAMQHHDQLTEDRVAGTLHRAEFLDRALRSSINREMDRLETGLTFLATVGSTAPFVGLFGTVLGISRPGPHRRLRRDLARPGGGPGGGSADHDGARPRGRRPLCGP